MECLHNTDRNSQPADLAAFHAIFLRCCRGWRFPRFSEGLLQLAAGPPARHRQRGSLLWSATGRRLGVPIVPMAGDGLWLASDILLPWRTGPALGARLDRLVSRLPRWAG